VLTKAELQRLRALREKKHREAEGVFVVEGEKVIGELLAANFPFAEIYATGDWQPAAAMPAGLRIKRVTEEEMTRASHFPTPSPVLAVGRIVPAPLAAGELAHGLTLALDRVQDAGNVGTLLRIADWFGCARVLLSPDSADRFHQKVINASMGSFARVRTHPVELETALASVGAETPILGCDLAGDDVHTLPPLRDAIVIVGSEGRGLSDALKPFVTRFVTIPKYGGAESLNAAIAAAIVCDNLRRGAK